MLNSENKSVLAGIGRPHVIEAVMETPVAFVGVTGEDGATFYPSVSEDGYIRWTNNKGLENPDPVIIKGPKGDGGEKGVGIKDIDTKGDLGNGYTAIDILLTDGRTEQVQIPNGRDGIGINNIFTEKNDDGRLVLVIQYNDTDDTLQRIVLPIYDTGITSLVQTTGDSETAVMSQKATTEAIEAAFESLTHKEDVEVPLNIETDGYYYYEDGAFRETSGRLYAIVDAVDPSKTYKLTTYTSSVLIAGVIYYGETNRVIGYDLLGTGTPQFFEKYVLSIPNGCSKMIVQCASEKNELSLFVGATESEGCSVYLADNITVKLGADLISQSSETLTSFTGDKTNGFTHDNTSGGSIQFYNAEITKGQYIMEFDTNYTGGEFVRCGFANDYKNLAYNGGKHIVMPIENTDGSQYLHIEAINNIVFTITNVTLRKITDDGDTYTIKTKSILNANNQKNFGFWNVVLGYSTAVNTVGSTRTIAIGNNALRDLKGGHRNIGIGTFSMSQMTGGEGNVSIGADSMLEVKGGEHNVMVGREAGYRGKYLKDNVGIGRSALFGGADSEAQYNVAIGGNAGYKCKSHRGTFVGHQAGYNIVSNYGNTMIGFNTLGQAEGYDNTCVGKQADFANGIHNSTALGANAKCTKSNQMVLGDASVNEFVLGNKKIIFNADGTVTWEALT